MAETPIETLKRMRLRDGDVVVVKCPYALSLEHHNAIKEHVLKLRDLIGINFYVVVLDSGSDIEVISCKKD